MNRRGQVQNLVTVALLAALICAIAPIALYIGPIPISLATLVIYVVVCIFSLKKCVAAVAIYILMGCVGLPVFSGYTAGIGQLIGPTGGFIAGYIVLSVISGVILQYVDFRTVLRNKYIGNACALAVGTVVLYFVGVFWYIFVTGSKLSYAIYVCVVPFIMVDIVKIVIAVILASPIKKRLVAAGIEL